MVSVEKNKAFITSFIVLIFVFLSFLLARPIIDKTSKQLESYKDALVYNIEKKLGIILSYEKMFPSILSTIKISNIIVYDTKDNSQLAVIPSIRVHISIFSLLKGEWNSIISSMSIIGLHLEYDALLDSHIFENLQAAFGENNKTNDENENLRIVLPFDLHFKSLTMKYRNNDFDMFFNIKTLRLFPQETLSTGYSIQGSLNAEIFHKDFLFLDNSQVHFTAQGSLAEVLDFSFLQLRITKFENKSFVLYPFDLAIVQEEERLWFSILQNAGSIALKADYNFLTKDIQASLKTSDFYPTKLIQIKNSDSSFHIFNTIRLSGDFSCTIQDLDFLSTQYAFNTSVQIPSSLFPEGLNLHAQGDGDLSKIRLYDLRAIGSLLDFDFEGSFSFETLKPEGFAEVHKIVLPSKNELNFELYIDGTRDGFMFFVPQLAFGEKNFTAVELNLIPKKESWDFSFLAYDYSHYDYITNAEIAINGSLLLEQKAFLQTNIAISNLFLDSIFSALEYSFSEKTEVFTSLKNNFSSFLTSTEIYLSTDFSQFSYNIPYAIIANTAKDKELVVFSLGGNESSLYLTQFDLLFANQSLESTASFDFLPGFTDAFFNISLTFNSIPYELQGSLIDKNNIFVSGSYGLEALVKLSSDALVSGKVLLNALPFSIQDSIFTLSLDTDFYYNTFFDWRSDISRLELSKTDGKDRLSPYLSMTGFVDTYGATMHSLQYADKISSLDGYLLSSWAFTDGILSRADLNIGLKNVLNEEEYALTFALTNPFFLPFSNNNFFDEVYISSEISLQNSPVERLLSQQNEFNFFNIDLSILGSLKKPSLSFSLYDSHLNLENIGLDISAHCLFENNTLSIPDANISSNFFSLSNLNASFDLESFYGKLEGSMLIKNMVNESLEKEFILTANSLHTRKAKENDSLFSFFELPEFYTLNLDIPKLIQKPGDEGNFSLSLVRSELQFDIQGGFGATRQILSKPAIQGYFTDLGDVLLLLDESLPIQLIAFGKINDEVLDLQFSDMFLDLSGFRWLLNFGEFRILKGIAKGDFSIGGYRQDPEFSGLLEVESFECEVPSFVPGPIRAESAFIFAEDKSLRAPDIIALTKTGNCIADLAFHFDKWMLERLDIDLITPKKEKLFVEADFGLLTVLGNAACDLHLEIHPKLFSITGIINAEDAQAKIYPSELINQNDENFLMDINVDLDIRVGMRSHVSLFLFRQINPIVRSLVSPNTQLRFVMDSRENMSYLEGDIILKGGEVNIGRSFYIKEGRFSFLETQGDFDPLVNLIAELRERDTNGEFVKIRLSALNQRLSTFEYTLTSSPPKSEVEIMSLLGKTLVYDPSGSVGQDVLNVIGAGLDTFVQNTLLREAEDRLRDFFKLDILTLRTSVLQNAIKLYSEDNSGKIINPGNFLDDSSVYIGKYFGDVLYGDLFLHLNYVEPKGNPNLFGTGLSFQPELGFEMEAPFATIRWGLAPDVGSMQNLWVPYTSLSLSWKILF